jgi:hypothetical protein
MLIYSNCNKFYRRSVVEALSLRFDERVSFGEDRLFNYRFLTGCGKVVTSELIMLRYFQRSTESMSARSIPRYFECMMELHRTKTEVFLALSKGTDEQERQTFCSRDLGNEIIQAVDRFALYPQEEKENLPAVNRLIFERFPQLKKLLRECGVRDPDGWYRLHTGRQMVIGFLRRFYDKE